MNGKKPEQKVRIRNEIISMVEKTKEKSTEKVHFIVRAIFVTQRIKRVVQTSDGQKARIKNEKCTHVHWICKALDVTWEECFYYEKT